MNIVIAAFRQKLLAKKKESVLPPFVTGSAKRKMKIGPGGFVEVTKGLKSSSGELELIYPNGVKLQMNAADLGLIARLVKLY